MRYTIESRELTQESTRRPSLDTEIRRMIVEASDDQEAIAQFLDHERSELVSFSHPARGREAIATVRKADSVYLVRVYAG